ncbi:unnamed protein product, partial [Polarella glacialis]
APSASSSPLTAGRAARLSQGGLAASAPSIKAPPRGRVVGSGASTRPAELAPSRRQSGGTGSHTPGQASPPQPRGPGRPSAGPRGGGPAKEWRLLIVISHQQKENYDWLRKVKSQTIHDIGIQCDIGSSDATMESDAIREIDFKDNDANTIGESNAIKDSDAIGDTIIIKKRDAKDCDATWKLTPGLQRLSKAPQWQRHQERLNVHKIEQTSSSKDVAAADGDAEKEYEKNGKKNQKSWRETEEHAQAKMKEIMCHGWANEDFWLLIQQLFVTACVGSTITKVAARTLLPDGASELQKEMHEGNRRADIQACAGADSHALKPEELKDYLTTFGQTLTQQLRLSEIIRRRWILLGANGFEDTVLSDEPRDGDLNVSETVEHSPLPNESLEPSDGVQAAVDPHFWTTLIDDIVFQCDGDVAAAGIPDAISIDHRLLIGKTTWNFQPKLLFAIHNYFRNAQWNSGHSVSMLELFVDFVYAAGVLPQYKVQKVSMIAGLLQTFLSAIKVSASLWNIPHVFPGAAAYTRLSYLVPLGLMRQHLSINMRPSLKRLPEVRQFFYWISKLTCPGNRIDKAFDFKTQPHPAEWTQDFNTDGNLLRLKLGLGACARAAAYNGRLAVAQDLALLQLDHHAKVDAEDSDGRTALVYPVWQVVSLWQRYK